MRRPSPLLWLVPSVLLAALLLRPASVPAAPEPPEMAYEFKHLILPLERKLEEYDKADAVLLEALRRSGEEGWQLISAYEPANGLKVNGRASVEFWLQRAYTTRPR
jgi:hypothetical protein